jgi:hypothetical protein
MNGRFAPEAAGRMICAADFSSHHRRLSATQREIDPDSRWRILLPRREDLDTEGQNIFDYFTSGVEMGSA